VHQYLISNTQTPPLPAGALESHSDERDGRLPQEIRQMLLVLQNVHRSPPKEAYFALQQLVGKVIKSYLPMVARSRTIVKVPSESAADGKSPTMYTYSKMVMVDSSANTVCVQYYFINTLFPTYCVLRQSWTVRDCCYGLWWT
jgi:hypothetical protein